ncbi:MAG: hypothetical protein ACP5J4_02000 [Anaerolineae bacterium]
MKPERAKKLRDACSLLALSLVAVSIAGLVLTGVLYALKQMTWAVGLFITLKMLAGVLLGGILGLALGLLVRRKRVILLSLLAFILIGSILFLHIRLSDLLSVHTPAMSGIVAPVADYLPNVGFLVGLVVCSYRFIRLRETDDSVGMSSS